MTATNSTAVTADQLQQVQIAIHSSTNHLQQLVKLQQQQQQQQQLV